MTPVKYTPLPTTEEEQAFDYRSVFTYGKNDYAPKPSFQSIYTYGGYDSTTPNKEYVSPLRTDTLARFLVTLGYSIIFIVTFPIIVWFSFKKVHENERLVVFRLGRLYRSKGPGLVLVFPLLDRVHKVNISLRAFSVPPKQVITEDKAIIEVGAEIYFQIVDAEKSVTNVQNLDGSTRILLQTALCNMLAQKSLSEIEAERTVLANALMVSSNKTCVNWGVNITRAELSQIKVLSAPPPKKTPQIFMPPGLFGSAGPSPLPTAFAQLAQAFSDPGSQGDNKAEVISQAMSAFVSGFVDGQTPSPVTASTNDLITLLGSGSVDQMTNIPLVEAETHLMEGHLPRPQGLNSSALLAKIRSALSESLVNKVGESYEFHISGQPGGTYFLDLKSGHGTIGEGHDPSGHPAAILSLNSDDLEALLCGELKPFEAYMSGRLKVSGDTSAALKLEELGTRIKSISAAEQIKHL